MNDVIWNRRSSQITIVTIFVFEYYTELDLDCNNVKPRLDNENGLDFNEEWFLDFLDII